MALYDFKQKRGRTVLGGVIPESPMLTDFLPQRSKTVVLTLVPSVPVCVCHMMMPFGIAAVVFLP